MSDRDTSKPSGTKKPFSGAASMPSSLYAYLRELHQAKHPPGKKIRYCFIDGSEGIFSVPTETIVGFEGVTKMIEDALKGRREKPVLFLLSMRLDVSFEEQMDIADISPDHNRTIRELKDTPLYIAEEYGDFFDRQKKSYPRLASDNGPIARTGPVGNWHWFNRNSIKASSVRMRILSTLFQYLPKKYDPPMTACEQECLDRFNAVKHSDAAASLALILLPYKNCDGVDYEFRYSELPAGDFWQHLRSHAIQTAIIFDLTKSFKEQWPYSQYGKIDRPKDIPHPYVRATHHGKIILELKR